MKNYYQILGINKGDSDIVVKQAYRKLALKFHPDKNDGDKFFEERFKEIQEAYEILSDANKRAKYDDQFDSFFNLNKNNGFSYKENEESKYKPNHRTERRKKEEQEKRNQERTEQERVEKIKRDAELSFEDKAWIFLGNWFIIPGAVGLWMFFKYRNQGFVKKSNSVCSLTILSFVILILLTIIITIGGNS